MGATFGFLTSNVSDDFSRTLAPIVEAHVETLGAGLVVNDADFDGDAQLSQFDALVQRGVDGIFLVAVDAASIGQAVRRADRKEIRVFIVGGAPARGEVIAVMKASAYHGSYDATAAMMEGSGEPDAKSASLGIPFALRAIHHREKGVPDAVGAAGGQIVPSTWIQARIGSSSSRPA